MTATTEPTPLRDNGPYETDDQALAQLDAIRHGMPAAVAERWGHMAILEALTGAGVELTGYEQRTAAALAQLTTPGACQVVAGWIVRAYIAGGQRPARGAGDVGPVDTVEA